MDIPAVCKSERVHFTSKLNIFVLFCKYCPVIHLSLSLIIQ